jgi:hypothetical protein
MPKNHPLFPLPPPEAAEGEREDGRETNLVIAFKLIHAWLKAMGVYLER